MPMHDDVNGVLCTGVIGARRLPRQCRGSLLSRGANGTPRVARAVDVKRGTLSMTLILLGLALSACGDRATLPEQETMGATPTLARPAQGLIPTVNIATAKGWPPGALPSVAAGLGVRAFASDLDHPRWLYTLPNGDVLVAETNAPPKPDDGHGIKAWLMKLIMRSAGAGTPSANRITLLRDSKGAGVADTKTVFLENLNSPFGMVLVGDVLYVACTDALLRFHYAPGATQIVEPGEKVVDLPAGTINHHWTKNVIANRDGSRLYVTVGSNSNAGENGVENEVGRAAILEIDPSTKRSRVFASGLRNPNGLGWQPQTGALWTVVNERDELGSDLVPDYLTSVRDGGFYGWPYSYYGAHVDDRVKPARPDLVASALVPDFALGSHVAPLGMAFYGGKLLGPQYEGGAFIAEHGSWNRRPRSGYKVVFVPFADGRPNGLPIDVLTGFVTPSGDAMGRPVGIVVDGAGALLVADDVGNVIWRVSPAPIRSAGAVGDSMATTGGKW
jgi:glucose/arabinose dehydrogenase